MPDVGYPRDNRRTAAGSGATGLPWLAWLLAIVVVVSGTTQVVVLAAVVLSCALGSALSSRRRRPLFTLAVGSALAATAVWTVWSLLIHRDNLGGTVLWVLPSLIQPSGGSYGGAVTVTQLHAGAIRALQAAALLLAVGLVAQKVTATRWLLLGDAVLGRAGQVVAPVACAGDAYLDTHAVRLRTIAAGFRSGSATFAGLPVASLRAAEAWLATRDRERTAVHGAVGFLVQSLLLAGWSLAILPGSPLPLSAMEATVLWLVAAVVAGLALHPGDLHLLRPTRADLPALGGVLAVTAAWCGRSATGEGALLTPAPGEFPPVPAVLLAALLVPPLLAAITRERT